MTGQTWTLRSGDDRAEISTLGAVALSWVVARNNGECELLDGYQSQVEHEELHGYRNAVLAPWSNRIRNSQFHFGGHDVDLGPDAAGVREALHGLVADAQFVEISHASDWVQLATQIPGTGDYPFPLQVHVEYRLLGTDGLHRLEMTLRVVNTGSDLAPITLGWHPYLRHLGPTELASISVPAATVIRTDEANIPLPGEDAFIDTTDAIKPDSGVFPALTRAGVAADRLLIEAPANLDHAFTDLNTDDDLWARAHLNHGDGSRVTVEFLPDLCLRGVSIFQIFTGEVLPERGGQSVAIEPCLTMTDAFNRDECQDYISIRPGDMQMMRAALVFSEELD